MPVHMPIIRTCLQNARRTLIVDDRREYRGAEILVAALHVASEIERRSQSQTVGLLLPTSGAFPICALAGWILGRTIVPLNYLLKPDELQYVIDDCGCDTIVTVGPMLDYLGVRPRVEHLIMMESIEFKTVPDLRWPARSRPDDLACLLYTSGTSGKPKGVMLSHSNLLSNVRQCLEHVGLRDEDVLLGVLPQFHSFGLTVLTILPLVRGLRAIYTARFVPQHVMRLLREHRPTMFVGIPSMYNALLAVKQAEPADFASLRFTVSGGEPLPEDVFERFRDRFGVTICEGYGLTETSPVTNWCRPEDWRRRSVGTPVPRVEQIIVDPASGKVLPQGREGEVLVRGPNRMLGYFNLPDETSKAITPEGWFRTGDMGRFDQDGHLSITGRIKEMLIVGGENVFPREIEEVINRHPSVHASAVIGMTDPMRGEVPVAFVELEEGETFDERSVLALCRDQLAGYKVPRDIRVLDALPRNPTGKIQRRQLNQHL
ncbi:MAG: AMP-binding protein [Planctomycetota bacterium]|nr:MAG: AMP-binding protein [Planctomycetota bacterium]